jgi:predicted metal-binding protein
MNITLCASCALGQSGFASTLQAALPTARITTTDCMSGCTRPSTIAFRAPGKTAYLFGDVTVDDLPHLVIFAQLYTNSPDGHIADARTLGPLRMKAMARIPG